MMKVHSMPCSWDIWIYAPTFTEECNKAEPQEIPQLSTQEKIYKTHKKQAI